jgi:hypothetical protein
MNWEEQTSPLREIFALLTIINLWRGGGKWMCLEVDSPILTSHVNLAELG